MAKQKAKRKVGKTLTTLFSLLVCGALMITLSSHGYLPFDAPTWDDILPQKNTAKAVADGTVATVHFIDCGQGDSIFIRQGEDCALIDAGQSYDVPQVIDYLNELNVSEIDSFILTHPDADHIGGAAEIIEAFDVSRIYMKKPLEGHEPTTKTYENLLDVIMEAGLKVKDPNVGDVISVGEFDMTVLGPVVLGEDNNDNSIVTRGVFGDTSFLFTGDASKTEEEAMLKENISALSSDVLKVGHHGSSSSTTTEFLGAVSPQIAVISCGADNSYGHPHAEVLQRLNMIDATVYRTDEDGTVVLQTDGKEIEMAS